MLAPAFLVLMYLGSLFDPAGALGLKYVGFVGFVAASLWAMARGQRRWPTRAHVAHAAFFVVGIPVLALALTYMRSGSLWLDGDFTFIASGAYLSHTLLLGDRKALAFALRALDGCLRVFAAFAILVTVSELIGVSLPGTLFLQQHGSLVVSSRSYGGCVLPYVYTAGSPLLLFGLARAWWAFFEKRERGALAWACIFSVALLCSGTRANMLMSAVGPFIVWLWARRGLGCAMAACAALLMLLVLGVHRVAVAPAEAPAVKTDDNYASAHLSFACAHRGVAKPLSGMLDPNERSNAIKLRYLQTYARLFADPSVLLRGQGLNARAWSELTRSFLPEDSHITELIYLELARIFGLPFALLIFGALAWPIAHWRKYPPEHAYCAAGWALYLVLALSNPYIFSSTGMTAFSLVLAALYATKEAPATAGGHTA